MARIFLDPVLGSHTSKVTKIVTLITACFSSCLDIMNLSAVNVAIPTIAEDLGLTTSTLPWLIASYAIAFAAFLIPAGKLGDIYGYRSIFLTGMALFALTSLINAVSPNQYVLFVFRALQGLAAACNIPNGIALITNSVDDEDSRRKALSMFGGSGPIGFCIGIIFGGILSNTIGWRWIFYISAICSALTFMLGYLYIPNPPKESEAGSIDFIGFFLITAGFIFIIFPLSDGQWKLARDPVTLVIGVLLLAAFLAWEFKANCPLIHPSWWRRPNFAVAFTVSFLNYASFAGYIYVATLMFQDGFGYDPITTALYYLPLGIVAFFVANSIGYLTPYTGTRLLIVIGALLATGANIGALFYSKEIGFWPLIFPIHVIMGIGPPIVYVAAQNAMIVTAPPTEAGTLGAIYNTSAQLGSAVGLAIMTAIISGVNGEVTEGMAAYPGYHAALYALIVFEGLAVILVALFIRNDPKQSTSEKDLEQAKVADTANDGESEKKEYPSATAQPERSV
jgi:EmrB/QacA subfamily drug resistance transporter